MLQRLDHRMRRGAGALQVEVDAVAQGVEHAGAGGRRGRPAALAVRPVVRRWAGLVAPRIGHGGEDGVAADPVGDGMMELEEQRRAVAGRQPMVETRLPERPRAVKWRFVGGSDLAPQFLHVACRRERVDADVVVEIERRVIFPVRQGEIERRVAHALCEARHRVDGALEGGAQTRRVGSAVEDHQHRHGGRLCW